MPRVLTVDGSVKIGAYRFPDRKKPCLPMAKKKALHIAADAMGLSFKEYMKLYRKEGKSLED